MMNDTSPWSSCSRQSPWLVTLFRSYNQFYRAECITISGFFVSQRQKENKIKRNIQFHANLKNLDSGGIESLKFYTDVSKAQVI